MVAVSIYLLTYLFTYLLTYLLTYSLTHSLTHLRHGAESLLIAHRFSASQQIPRILWNPKATRAHHLSLS
jgi:hypothetical protein